MAIFECVYELKNTLQLYKTLAQLHLKYCMQSLFSHYRKSKNAFERHQKMFTWIRGY